MRPAPDAQGAARPLLQRVMAGLLSVSLLGSVMSPAAQAQVNLPARRGDELDVLAEAIVKGDSKVQAISAASILAKVHRDRLCEAMHQRYPAYGFDQHKGYPTALHLERLRLHGVSPVHRKSYAPVRALLS